MLNSHAGTASLVQPALQQINALQLSLYDFQNTMRQWPDEKSRKSMVNDIRAWISADASAGRHRLLTERGLRRQSSRSMGDMGRASMQVQRTRPTKIDQIEGTDMRAEPLNGRTLTRHQPDFCKGEERII